MFDDSARGRARAAVKKIFFKQSKEQDANCCLAATALLLLPCCYRLAAIACCYCLLLCSQKDTLEAHKANSQAKKGFAKHGDKHPTTPKAVVADQKAKMKAKAKRATGGKKGVVVKTDASTHTMAEEMQIARSRCWIGFPQDK